MHTIAYRRAEVEQVVDASLRLLAQRPGGEDPNDHQLRALIPLGAAPPPLAGTRPLVATATTMPTRVGEALSVTPLVAGVFPGSSDQLGATLELVFTPTSGGSDTLEGRLDARFEPPLRGMRPVAFAFRLAGARAIPLAPGTLAACGAPGGAGEVFRCIAAHAANALLPALSAGVTGLAGGPEGFLAMAGMAAAAQLPRAVSGAIGCLADERPDGPAGHERIDVLSYPLAEARHVLEAATPERLLRDGAQPLGEDRWDELVCSHDDGLYHLSGLLAQTPAGAASARGSIEGQTATLPAEWHFSIEVAEPLIVVTVESFAAPRFTHCFSIRDDGTYVPDPCRTQAEDGFEVTCLLTSAGGPLLRLTAACLARLRDGVRPFLRAMLDGAGEALGSAVTTVVRRCIAAPARDEVADQPARPGG